jgi:hypothetical protein
LLVHAWKNRAPTDLLHAMPDKSSDFPT